jgi:hypothetical protein
MHYQCILCKAVVKRLDRHLLSVHRLVGKTPEYVTARSNSFVIEPGSTRDSTGVCVPSTSVVVTQSCKLQDVPSPSVYTDPSSENLLQLHLEPPRRIESDLLNSYLSPITNFVRFLNDNAFLSFPATFNELLNSMSQRYRTYSNV